jgi:hypothetical protein
VREISDSTIETTCIDAPVNYAIRFSDLVNPFTARRVRHGVGAGQSASSQLWSGIKAFGPPPLFPHLCESLFLPSLSCMAILPQAFASSTFFHASPPGLYRRIRRGQSEKCLVVIASSYSLTPSAALSGRPSQPWIN